MPNNLYITNDDSSNLEYFELNRTMTLTPTTTSFTGLGATVNSYSTSTCG